MSRQKQFYPQNNPYTSKYFYTTQTGSIRQISNSQNSIEQSYNPVTSKIGSRQNLNQNNSIILQHPNHISSKAIPYGQIAHGHNQQYMTQMSVPAKIPGPGLPNGQNNYSQNQINLNSAASVKFLQEKVECLQNQLMELTEMLKDEGSNGQIAEKFHAQLSNLSNSLKKQKNRSREFQQDLQKQRNLNKMLRKQLQQSEQINQQLRTSLTTMGDQLQSFGREVQNSRQMMTNSRTDTHKMHQQIMGLTSKLQQMSTQYQLVEREKQSYIRQYEEETKIVQSLKREISNLKEDNYRFEREVEKYTEINQKDRQHVEDIINQNQRQLFLMSEELKWYKEKLQQVQQGKNSNININKQQQQVFSFSSQKNVVKSTVQWMPNQGSSVKSQIQLNQPRQNVRDRLEKELGSEAQLSASQLENRRIKKQIQSLSERESQTKEKYKQIIQQLEQEKNNSMNQAYSLKSQLRRIENLVKQKEFDLQQLKSKQKHSSSLWNEKQKFYQAELGRRNEQIKSLSNELNDTTCQMNQLKDQMSIINHSQSHSHQQSGINEKVFQLQLQVDRKKEELRRSNDQKLIIEQELEKQRRKYAALKNEVQNGNSIQTQLDNLISQIDDIRKSNEFLEQENSNLKSTLNQYKRDTIPKYQRQINLLKSNINELENRIEEITRNFDSLSKENHISQKEAKSQDYQSLKQQYSRQIEQNRNLAGTMGQLQILYEQKVRRQKDYLIQIKNLKNNYEKTVRTFQQLKIIVSNLQEQKGFYAIDNSSLKSQVKSLEVQVIALQGQRTQLEKYNDQLKMEMRKLNVEQNNINSQHKKFIEKYEKLLSSEQEKQKLETAGFDYYENQIQSKICEISELKNQIIALKKQALQKQHEYSRKFTSLQQQIQRMQIQNNFHRANIDKFFREGILITQNGTMVSQTEKSTFNLSKMTKQNLNELSEMLLAENQQKAKYCLAMLQQHESQGDVHQSNFTRVADFSIKRGSNSNTNNFRKQSQNLKNVRVEKPQYCLQTEQMVRQQQQSQFKFPQHSAHQQRYSVSESSRNVNLISNGNGNHSQNQNNNHNQHTYNTQANQAIYLSDLQEQNQILRKRIQRANKDVAKLKRCIDQHLLENGITPRQDSTCAIARAIWLVEIISTNIKQYRTDIETLKIQKREILTKTQKLQIQNQSLSFDKERMMAQMQLMLEKMRYLEHSQKQNQDVFGSLGSSYPYSNMGKFSFKDTTNVDGMGILKMKPPKNNKKSKFQEQKGQGTVKTAVQFTFGTEELQSGIKRSWIQKMRQHEKGQDRYAEKPVQNLMNKLYKNKSASSLIIKSGMKKKQLPVQAQDQESCGQNYSTNNMREVPRLRLQQQGQDGLRKISTLNLAKYKQDRRKLLQLNNKDLLEMNQEDAVQNNSNSNSNKEGRSSPYSLSEDNCEDYVNSEKHTPSNPLKKRTKKFDKSKYINHHLRNAEFEQEHINNQKYFS